MFVKNLDVYNSSENESMKICLEPYCEFFVIPPSCTATIKAEFNSITHYENTASVFGVQIDRQGLLVVYAPGLSDDLYVEIKGIRIAPTSEY